ncbi:hypothetical protein [Thiomicrorhabdus xiamenensis]|uniref:Solute:sodium symporter small subunit n=1 Tax=Thiomicrorhabdus xiamenensis TaxID=2739063 RepID=A0A7D4NPR5_9GAMM|nr:hypothetical protein [Thiomicrorhabdus xiamenensis]QKI88172.1 hypothetical protein HQN79_00585 [Thiomicrorhabdus xiamenensis]
MELGSKQHKQLLLKSILKVAWKTASIGIFIGILLIIPSIFRENTFSSGLAYSGYAVIIGFVAYAAFIAWRKYHKLIKNFS